MHKNLSFELILYYERQHSQTIHKTKLIQNLIFFNNY